MTRLRIWLKFRSQKIIGPTSGLGEIIGPTSCLGEIIGPTSGWIIAPSPPPPMRDETWPAWVNKISVLILYFSSPFNVAGFRNENAQYTLFYKSN